MTRIPARNPIEYLIKRKFPDYSALQIPTSLSNLARGGIPSDYRREKLAEIDAYRAELESKSDNEVQALCDIEQSKERNEWQARAEREEQQRFFNLHSANADFVHWSKAAHWTLDEAIALSFGKAPEAVTWERVGPYANVSPFAEKYARVRDLALRAKAWNQLYDPVLPGIFLAWARRSEIEVPTELMDQVEKRGIVIADWKDLHDNLKSRYDEMLMTANQEISKGNEAVFKYRRERESLIGKNEELQKRLAEIESSRWDGFDPDSNTYPPELDIALQAWRGVTNLSHANATAKEQIERWLDTHYPDRRVLSNEARQRIAVICNWEKSGGRRRRDEK